jgi:flagellar FliJ protein
MAKKFNFKLESVLKFRADKVNQAMDALNQVVKIRLEKEKMILDTIQLKLDIANQIKSKVKASELQAKNNHLIFLDDEIKKLEHEKKQIVEIENLRRIKLTNAMKDEKVIEKLKEKQLDNYKEDLKKEESIFLDELGIKGIEKNKKNW